MTRFNEPFTRALQGEGGPNRPMCLVAPREHVSPYRELAILTRPASVREGTPGHALITLNTAGSGEEGWGYYPDGLLDELEPNRLTELGRYTRVVVVRNLTEDQYAAIRATVSEWRESPERYKIGLRDCTGFVTQVMRAAGLREQDRSTLWPDTVGSDLERHYGTGGVRCLVGPPGGATF